jgi:hypothetical protein
MVWRIAFVALVALSPASALADPPAGRAGPHARQPDPNRRVCRGIEDSGWRTGGGRVCKTQADWDRIARQNDDDYQAAMRPRGTGMPDDPFNHVGHDGPHP